MSKETLTEAQVEEWRDAITKELWGVQAHAGFNALCDLAISQLRAQGQGIKNLEAGGYRAIQVEVREVNAAGQENASDGADTEARVRSCGQSVDGDPVPAAPTHDALADEFFAALDTALKTDERTTWTGTVKHTHRERAHAWSTFNALREKVISALRQSGAGRASISEFEQIVNDESAQWKGTSDDTHGAQTACQMILQKIAALKERTE